MTGGLNARTRFIDVDTHAADLTGSLTKDNGTPVGSSATSPGLSSLESGTVQIGSFAVTPTESSNLIIFKFDLVVTQDANIQIKEGANVLATSGTSGDRTINHTEEDVSVETHTYTFFVNAGAVQYQYHVGGQFILAVAVNVDDTHAADLTGANLSKSSSPSGGRST